MQTPTEPMNILVVEDDRALASVISRALAERGHVVRCVDRGDTALDVASTDGSFDVVVLDVMLPGLDGIEVCRRLRSAGSSLSIIMLTARSEVEDRIGGLHAGADDYLAKPFSLRELHARIEAVVRRRKPSSELHGHQETLSVGELTLNVDDRTCCKRGQTIELRAKEHAVLQRLMEQPGRIVSRMALLDHAWDENMDHRSNVIDVQIRRIREKIDTPFGTESIETIRGLGYRFRSEVAAHE